MRVLVDGTSYPSKKKALAEFKEAAMFCDGSEGERMKFAYFAILDGCTVIDTYEGTAE